MTVVVIASVKGAPGVTTLSCLVAASWPQDRNVVLVECDPSGGDLAARFRLSTKRGWSSFAAASRRLQGLEEIASHVQQLPGGLDVMIRAKPIGPSDEDETVVALLTSARSCTGGPWDVVADVGRLLPGARGAEEWLKRSTAVAIVLRRDAASALHVRDRAPMLLSSCPGRVGLVVVGPGPFTSREIEAFTGLPVLGDVPEDPDAAQIVSGRPGGPRRLSRSILAASSQRLAVSLSRPDPFATPRTAPPASESHETEGPQMTRSDSWRKHWEAVRVATRRLTARSVAGKPVATRASGASETREAKEDKEAKEADETKEAKEADQPSPEVDEAQPGRGVLVEKSPS